MLRIAGSFEINPECTLGRFPEGRRSEVARRPIANRGVLQGDDRCGQGSTIGGVSQRSAFGHVYRRLGKRPPFPRAPNGLDVKLRGQGPRDYGRVARRLPAFEVRDADGVTPPKYR